MSRRGVSVQVEGLDKLIQRFGKIPTGIAQEIDAELSAVAKEFEARAVHDAPVDQGLLKNSITTKKDGEMNYQVVSGADWSAYIEWGTRRRAKIPADQVAFAAQFKGKGKGGGKGFYDSILAWVKRKGIAGTYSVKSRRRQGSAVNKQIEDEQIAFAIYVSILRNGVKPHPFFFKQLPQARADINKNLKAVVQRALKP